VSGTVPWPQHGVYATTGSARIATALGFKALATVERSLGGDSGPFLNGKSP